MKLQLIKNQFFSSGPSHLILHVTNRCNLRCQTCFVETNSIPPAREITLADIRSVAGTLKNLIFADIGGGEPFLRDDLTDICASLKTSHLSIPTNGSDPEKIRDTVRRIRGKTRAALTISVSLDGFEDTHDEIRGAGSFQKALQTIFYLKSVPGIHLKVNTVLCNRNYTEIIGFMEYVGTLEADFHSLMFLRGRPRVEALQCPSSRELRIIKEKVLTIWKSYTYGLSGIDTRLLRNYHKNIFESSLRVMEEKRQTPPCLAYKHHLVVYPDGRTAFCEMLPPFGNILKKPLPALLKEAPAVQQTKQIKSRGCFCYHNCNLMDNFFLNVFQYPKIIMGL